MFILSCSKEKKFDVDVSTIEVETVVERFDEQFYTTPPEKLNVLKLKYPYLFPAANPDTVWTNKMQNEDELDLFKESQKIYSDFSKQEYQLEILFKHIKFYYPNFREPKTITILSNVDYENNVILADSLLFISLDIFLGKESEIYADFPKYIKQNYTEDHLIVSVAEAFVDKLVPPTTNKSLISRMIQEGKKMYLVQSFLPHVNSEEIIGYTKDQLTWAELSETEIWKYFIENEMLFDTNAQLSERFIDDAPFSKFFLEIDKESPGRIGAWFGWQIVKAYMNNNKMSLQEMVIHNNEDIFNKSKYKPQKR